MASKKKESTGIALLSMYSDEDDEMEDINEEEEEEDNKSASNTEEDLKNNNEDLFPSDNTLQVQEDKSTSMKSGSSPQQPLLSLASPPSEQVMPDSKRIRREMLTIVSYGHDEVAMSPEAEEGEIVSAGRVMFGAELQAVNGEFKEAIPSGNVQVLTPSTQETPPQSSEQLDTSQAETLNHAVSEPEAADVDDDVKISLESSKDVDPLDKFLPPPPKAKCSEELQEKINKFLAYKRAGKSFNAEVRNKKDYRNPDFLVHAVRYQDIDQIGSCFSKDVFDPHGYDKSDYYDEIEADMKREMERKEQERKRSQKVEFVAGGMQPGIVATAPKINMPIPAISAAVNSVPTVGDVAFREGRQKKKSKWDKVDGDRRNTIPSGAQDSLSTVGGHAVVLSAANAGAGYTAFAQQRRREAEEKRSNERKSDRRS